MLLMHSAADAADAAAYSDTCWLLCLCHAGCYAPGWPSHQDHCWRHCQDQGVFQLHACYATPVQLILGKGNCSAVHWCRTVSLPAKSTVLQADRQPACSLHKVVHVPYFCFVVPNAAGCCPEPADAPQTCLHSAPPAHLIPEAVVMGCTFCFRALCRAIIATLACMQTFQDYPQLFMFGMLTAETGAMVSPASRPSRPSPSAVTIRLLNACMHALFVRHTL